MSAPDTAGATAPPADRNNWQTPLDLIKMISDSMGGIALDPCTTDDNPVGAARYYTPADDGLTQSWEVGQNEGVVYCNPPFGRGQINNWTTKVLEEAARGVPIVLMTRGDMSTSWARRLGAQSLPHLVFLRRLRFRGAKNVANFPVVLWCYNIDSHKIEQAFGATCLIVHTIPYWSYTPVPSGEPLFPDFVRDIVQ